MIKKYDTVVLIGRFQPIHNAHLAMIKRATELAKQVIIIVGSANKPRTAKDPFTAPERILMIKNAIADSHLNDNFGCSIDFASNIDTLYNDVDWATRIQGIVKGLAHFGQNIAIIGHKKDDSSFYLDMFPQWGFIEFPLSTELHATDIRGLYFKRKANLDFLSHVIPESTLNMLRQFSNSPAYHDILDEVEFIEEHKKVYSSLPYPPTFNTADAVVVQSGHVLLIKRRAVPGKGLWALPGGYLNAKTDKSLQACMLRELREETKLKVPAPVLIGNIKQEKQFDAIARSPRGRIITQAFHIELPAGPLPPVKGSDDAMKAWWCPIVELASENMFEDHYEIIKYFIG